MSRPTRYSGRKPEGPKVTSSVILIGAGVLLLILAGLIVLQTMRAPSPGVTAQATIARPQTLPARPTQPKPARPPTAAEPGASPIPMLPPPATIGPPGPQDIAQGPRISVSALEHDFGDIHPTTPVSHVFVFTNTGQSELVIERLVAS